MSDLRPIKDDDFDATVLTARGVSVVEFGAVWCPPCKALEPTLKVIAAERAGTVGVFKLDVDESPGISERYGIRGMPTILFFKDGELADRLVGNQSKANIDKVIARHL